MALFEIHYSNGGVQTKTNLFFTYCNDGETRPSDLIARNQRRAFKLVSGFPAYSIRLHVTSYNWYVKNIVETETRKTASCFAFIVIII